MRDEDVEAYFVAQRDPLSSCVRLLWYLVLDEQRLEHLRRPAWGGALDEQSMFGVRKCGWTWAREERHEPGISRGASSGGRGGRSAYPVEPSSIDDGLEHSALAPPVFLLVSDFESFISVSEGLDEGGGVEEGVDSQDALCNDSILDVWVNGYHDLARGIVTVPAKQRARVLIIRVLVQEIVAACVEEEVHARLVEVSCDLCNEVRIGARRGEAHCDHTCVCAWDLHSCADAQILFHCLQRS